MRSPLGSFFVEPGKMVRSGELLSAIERCPENEAMQYDVYFRGFDGAVEWVEGFENRADAYECAEHFGVAYVS